MVSLDSYTWRTSNGWRNGAPFQVGWRSDHVDIYTNTSQPSTQQLRLRLDNIPCVTNITWCSNQNYASGEYSSVDLLPFGRVTFTAQVAKASGVVTGLFLYTGQSDAQQHDEIDIEFLGNDTTKIQLNYFVNGVGGNEVLLPLGFDASLAMHRYSIAWKDTGINWYVDDVLVHSVTGQNLPSQHMRIFSNLWAATGVDTWAGAFVYPQIPIYTYVDDINYDAWTTISAVTNSTDTVPLDKTGGGCITPSAPVFIWMLWLGFLWLYWNRIARHTKESICQR